MSPTGIAHLSGWASWREILSRVTPECRLGILQLLLNLALQKGAQHLLVWRLLR